ncbi:MAG: IS66 family transposase [Bacteroidota bacterium]
MLEKIALLEAEVARLQTENTDLRQRLNQNSQNSSQPPSSDRFKAKPAFPKSQDRLKGGQLGHPGKTLEMSACPDQIVTLLPPAQCPCGASLHTVPVILQERRQVVDFPSPTLLVTEYQQYGCCCPSCQAKVTGVFPVGLSNHVQYGSGVLALCTLLSTSFHLSCKHISQLFEDMYGQLLNEATVLSANSRAFQALEASEQVIQSALLEAKVVHFDETGLACEGRTHWLHCASTPLFTYLFVHAKRGLKALQSPASLVNHFKHWALHDCWRSYFTFKDCFHALCNAHLIRQLQALIEGGSAWAIARLALLWQLYHHSDKGKGQIADLSPYLTQYDHICTLADQEEPPPTYACRGKPKRSKGRNLLKRLLTHKNSVVAFARYDFVPFTNNQAERDIRPVKGKIKTAGCFRTITGANHYARIEGFISTARKQRKSVFNELKNAYSGSTFLTPHLYPAK